ncbi:MAG: hypothetical protein HC875_03660 [Anaerolineales bacterium]|nr:hypothetical protein [Anaerolineales bacterium]
MRPSTQANPTGRLARFLTAPLILLLAAVLRFYNLSGQSLWADEGNSAALVRHSFIEIARRTAFDIHPPFYYWLLKSWVSVFGSSEIGLRSLSVGLGVGLVYVIGILGTRWFSPVSGCWPHLSPPFRRCKFTTRRKPACTCCSLCWVV